MGTIEDWQEKGGLKGQAIRVLENELSNAESDKTHPLWKAVKAQQSGNPKKYEKLLYQALAKAAVDPSSPLSLPGLLMVTVPVALAGMERAEKILARDDYPETFYEMARLGTFHLMGEYEGYSKSKSSGGKKRAKNLDAKRQEVYAAWQAYPYKNKGHTAFARFYFNSHKGKTDAEGNTKKSPVPAIRTIAKWVSELERK